MEKAKSKRKGLKIAVGVILGLIIILVAVMAVYFGDYYHSVDVEEYLTSGENVTVTVTDEGYFFDGEGTDTALIFYPGAKVEATAYAPLMYEIAESGIDCILVEMPFNFAVFGVNKALDITEKYDYDTWILGGHSLGGAMAAKCASENADLFDALLLLAAYSTEETSASLPVLSLYGSEDGVLNMENVENGRALAQNYTEIVIEGGNHAQFGSYGSQDGDNNATISAEEQRAEVIKALEDILKD